MSSKGTSLADQAALTALTWTVLQAFYKRKHVRNTPKNEDFKDSKYATKKGPKKEAVMANLSQEAKNIIEDKIRQRKRDNPDENKDARAENIAGSLISDNSFLQSIGNIFTSIFTGISPRPTEEEEEEEEPTPSDEREISEDEREISEDEEQETIRSAFDKALNAIKREIKSQEGKGSVDEYRNDYIERTRNFIPDNTLLNINNLIGRLIDGGYLGNNEESYRTFANIGTEFLFDVGEITKQDRERRIEQGITFGNMPTFAASNRIPRQFTITNADGFTEQIQSRIGRKQYEKNTDYLERLKKLLKVDLSIYDDDRVVVYRRELFNELRRISGIVKAQEIQTKKREKEREDKAKLLKESQKQQEEETRKITTKIKKTEKRAIEREDVAREERADIKSNMNKILEQNPELKIQFKNIEKKIERTPISGGSDMRIEQKQINQIIDNIPSQYREALRPSVTSLLGGGRGLDANTIASGILALTLTSVAGPLAGTIGSSVANYMRKSFNIDLNDYVFAEAETPTPPEREPEPEPERPTPTKRVVPPLVKPKEKKEEDKKEDKKEDQKDIYATGWMPYKQPIGLDAPTQQLKTWLEMHENEYMNPSVPNIGGMVQKSVDYYEARLEEYIRRTEQKMKDPFKPQERTDEKPRKLTETDEEEIRLFADDGEETRQPDSRVEPVVYRNLRPVRGDVERGAQIGAVAGAVSSGLSNQGIISAQQALGGIVTGAAAGAVGRSLSISALRNFYIRRGENPDDPTISRRIKYLSTIPAAAAASLVGYTKAGQEVTTGAGITEKRITVEPEVLAQTQAKIDQDDSKNKQWQPKTITPTPNILDESKQEKYADDVEFVAFNYIPPTSEGAEGTVDTNPLKYQQLLESKIRYTDAGVYIPYITWNKINDANNMTSQQLKSIMMGPELPRMKFNTFDNDTTFENVSKWQYVNNENTSIEYQSDYSDFSNVENSWWTNENNVLFTINP